MDVSGFNWAAIPDKNDQEQIEANLNKRLLDIGEEKTKLIKEATGKLPQVARGIFADFICSKFGFGQTAAKIKELDKEKFAIDKLRASRTQSFVEGAKLASIPSIPKLIKETEDKITFLESQPTQDKTRVDDLKTQKKQLAGFLLIQSVTNKVLQPNERKSHRESFSVKRLTQGLAGKARELSTTVGQSLQTVSDRVFKKQPAIESRRQSVAEIEDISSLEEATTSQDSEKLQKLGNRLRVLEIELESEYGLETIDNKTLVKLRIELNELKKHPSENALKAFEKKLDDLESPSVADDESLELANRYSTFKVQDSELSGMEGRAERSEFSADVRALTTMLSRISELDEQKKAASTDGEKSKLNGEIAQCTKELNEGILKLLEALVASDDIASSVKALSGTVRLKLIKEIGSLKKNLSESQRQKADAVERELKHCSNLVVGNALLDRIVREITSPIKPGHIDEYLYLTSKSVIETPLLFDLIEKKLADPGTDLKTRKALLIFTLVWVEKNIGTKEFAKLAPKGKDGVHQLLKITQAASKTNNEFIDPAILQLCERIEAHATEKQALGKKILDIPVGKRQFPAILSSLREDRLGKEYEQTIEDLADDLFLANATFYSALTKDMLAEDKWLGDKHPIVAEMSAFADNMSKVIAVEILQENDPAKQARMIKFFIRLANACLERGDLQSMVMIMGAVNGTNIVGLTDKNGSLIEQIKADREYGRMFARMAEISSPEKNRSKLRELLSEFRQDNKPCVPFMGLYLSDLTFIRDGNPQTQAQGDSNEQCNEKKLTFIDKTIGDCLAFSKAVKSSLSQVKAAKTDLYTHINLAPEFNEDHLLARRKDSEAKALLRGLRDEERQAIARGIDSVDVSTLSPNGLTYIKTQLQAQREQTRGDLAEAFNSLTKEVSSLLEDEQLDPKTREMLDKFLGARSKELKIQAVAELSTLPLNALASCQKAIAANKSMEQQFSSVSAKVESEIAKRNA